MFLARNAKQQEAERKSDDALAEHKTHHALAQLSVSGDKRKTKARKFDREHDYEHEYEYERRQQRLYNMIERRRWGITIQRGGPHR
jgi:hypothetical protein